jgi:putative transposase
MCRIFSVSRNGFYCWLKRGKSRRDEANEELVSHIRQVYEESE